MPAESFIPLDLDLPGLEEARLAMSAAVLAVRAWHHINENRGMLTMGAATLLRAAAKDGEEAMALCVARYKEARDGR